MQSPVLFADETFFVVLSHVCVQFVVVNETFPTKLTHWMSFDVNVF
jgi:hypothetical protein